MGFSDRPILTWRHSEQQPQGLQRDERSESASSGYCSHLPPAANSDRKKSIWIFQKKKKISLYILGLNLIKI